MKKRSVIAIAALAAMSFQALATTPFGVTSRDISGEKRLAQQQVFEGFGCHGGNISPQLAWKNPPAGTKSFAVTVYDPDAPTGSGWWHWTVANIPAKIMTLPADAGNPNGEKLPAGVVQGRNDFGYSGFGGACPPEGDKLIAIRLPSGLWTWINCPSTTMPAARWSVLCSIVTLWQRLS